MSALALTLVHAKYSLLETARVPIAIIGSLVFPALSLLFFVVPNRAVADDPVFATQAVISLSVFAVLANGLFGFGLTIAENREKPWDPYLRTLPAPGISRVLAHVLSTGVLALVSIVPVIVIGGAFTAAEASFGRVLLGMLALAVAALPFMFAGICIGYAMPAKAAIAVVQVVMFGLAFGGGLFLPPQLFAEWLDILSRFLPSRHAREFVVWAVQGGDLEWWVVVGIAAWTIVLLALALVLFRRDEGRRYR
ncbi:ABC-2 type transport system permease protein [Diaminobutyricimonas aerilata]|uniref:ABC-2 type transport system permease protein n=1 Tax=Diaminobutyricimonas aerilata TaxID=1162967 RepID=A0A2M9CLQ9_9MICO|nr:ABC transporter permease [Diaminobutyricimonas aerilata]PJJ72824.1 ABC-2 type transport system permease protein [Diaminobutyricimonas aerilata]